MRQLAKHFVELAGARLGATGVFGAARAVAERDRFAAVEHARELQLLQHPVDAIDRLIDVLENEDAVGEIGHERSSTQRREYGEVSSHQSAFRLSRVDLARIWRRAA